MPQTKQRLLHGKPASRLNRVVVFAEHRKGPFENRYGFGEAALLKLERSLLIQRGASPVRGKPLRRRKHAFDRSALRGPIADVGVILRVGFGGEKAALVVELRGD